MTTAIEGRATPRVSARPATGDVWCVVIVVLSSLQPFAAFLAANAVKIIQPSDVVFDALAWTALVLVAYAAIRALARQVRPLAIAAGLVAFNISFWNFGRWLPYEPPSTAARWIGIAVWTLVTVLLVRLAVRLAEWKSARLFLVLMLGFWTLSSVLAFALARPAVDGGARPTTYDAPFPAFTQRPNVYWFLLDEHADATQVERWTGVDTSWFADDLQTRGFATSQATHSGYLFTNLSISSTLAMDYAYTPGNDYTTEYPLAVPFVAGDNPVVQTFEANGYRYVFAPDGSTEWIRCPELTGDRVCIQPEGGPLALAGPRTDLVRSTPVGSLGLPLVHNDFTSVLDGVDAIRATDPDRPLFTFAHILSPHYAYRYGTDCAMRSPWVEGASFTGEERAAAYGNEVQCVDHDAVRAVDRILASDPDAVIIIQGDHGSSLTFNWQTPYEEWTDANFSERLSPLSTMRLPASCADRSIDGQPLVNTFRIVLACLSGTEPDLLPTRVFYSGYGTISELTEVPVERLHDP